MKLYSDLVIAKCGRCRIMLAKGEVAWTIGQTNYCKECGREELNLSGFNAAGAVGGIIGLGIRKTIIRVK